MQQAALELFQMLTQAGAIPGEDFSCDPEQGAFRVNERGFQLLSEVYPDVDWLSITQVLQQDGTTAIKTLHDHLGFNFTDHILDRICQQLDALPYPQLAWYLAQVLGGVEMKTGIPLYRLLEQRLEPHRMAQVEILLREEQAVEPCGDWIYDLVVAAGGTAADVHITPTDACVTEQGLRLLATVWAGETNLFEEMLNL